MKTTSVRLISFLILIFVFVSSSSSSSSFFFFFSPTRSEASESPDKKIGMVMALTGTASVLRGTSNVTLAEKDEVFLSDVVTTGPDGKVQILFDDDGTVTFGPDTECELSDFVLDGTNSSFGADLWHGTIRVITGVITESNPEGFKIVTPHTTIGVRGTILTVEADLDHTTLHVNNTSRSVTINGVTVRESQKATVTGSGQPVIESMTQEDRDSDLDLALPVGGDDGFEDTGEAPAEGQLDLTGGGPAPTSEPPSISEPVPIVVPTPIAPATPTTASVSGNLNIAGDSSSFGKFGFTVNLQNGNITNGAMNGKGADVDIGTTYTFNFTDGTGSANAAGFNVTGFSGSGAAVDSNAAVTQLDPGASNMSGSSNLIDMPNGGNVPVNFNLINNSGNTAASGTGQGSLTK